MRRLLNAELKSTNDIFAYVVSVGERQVENVRISLAQFAVAGGLQRVCLCEVDGLVFNDGQDHLPNVWG